MPEEYGTDALVREFLEEAEEHFELLDRGLLELESGAQSGAAPRAECVDEMFRATHTLKGLASMFDFGHVKDLAHRTETVLDGVRKNEIVVDGTTLALLFDSVDALRDAIRRVTSDDQNVAATLEAVEHIDEFLSSGEERVESHPVGGELHLSEYAAQRLTEAQAAGIGAFVIDLRWGLELRLGTLGPVDVGRALGEGSELLEVVPRLDLLPRLADLRPDIADVSVEAYVVSKRSAADISDSLGVSVGSIVPFGEVRLRETEGAGAAAAADRSQQERVRIVRVDISKLDSLMDLTGELVTARTRLADLAGQLRERMPRDETVAGLTAISKSLTALVDELQGDVMAMRLVPVGQMLQRFQRVVRDAARAAGKDIRLELEGEHTELDKRLVEQLEDPLLHMVRNACDHGLESPDARRAVGKDPQGVVRIAATHEGNHVAFQVSDDGKGLDRAAILAHATEAGIITEDAVLSEADVLDLIMAPGFSTAATVTDVSGRGVGLDVVRKRIGDLNGRIEVASQTGKGTTFRLRLPLTLAIITALLVRLGEDRYAIPLATVAEVLRITKRDVRTVKGVPVHDLRGEMLPLVDVAAELARTDAGGHHRFVVVVSSEGRRAGLLVDELVGRQEIVVKNLEEAMGRTRGISGATILGDGIVVPIIDVDETVRLTQERRRAPGAAVGR